MPRLAILMFCVFSITTGEFVVAGILPEVAADLGVTIGTAGSLVTPYAVGMVIGGPVLTASTATTDRKRLMLALLAVAVAGNAVSALAPDFSVALLGTRVSNRQPAKSIPDEYRARHGNRRVTGGAGHSLLHVHT